MDNRVSQTSASDRYEAARKVLAAFEGEVLEGQGSYAWTLADALRALITPPSVGESEEQIAEQIAERVMVNQVGEANPEGEYTTDGAEILGMIRSGVFAGIQTAHETWEPEVAQRPSQEQMLRWLGLDYEQHHEKLIFIQAQSIEREEI